MPKRKIVVNAEVDSRRAFPILANYSNLTHHTERTVPMYIEDIVTLRSQLSGKQGVYATKGVTENKIIHSQVPTKQGIYATHGLTENKVLDLQAGSGFVSDGVRYARSGVKYARGKAADLLEYGADKGIDYVADYSKGKVRGVTSKVRGSGFFRSLAGNAVKGIGNLVGDTIKGGSARPANMRPRRRPAKGLVYTPEQEMALQPEMEGNGFFRSLAGNAVKGIGNLVGDTIKGGKVRRKRKTNKSKGKGLVAAGMSY